MNTHRERERERYRMWNEISCVKRKTKQRMKETEVDPILCEGKDQDDLFNS